MSELIVDATPNRSVSARKFDARPEGSIDSMMSSETDHTKPITNQATYVHKNTIDLPRAFSRRFNIPMPHSNAPMPNNSETEDMKVMEMGGEPGEKKKIQRISC
ncbi:MAG: hypothetical protein WBM45_12390 [Woeseiaceae bacterium]